MQSINDKKKAATLYRKNKDFDSAIPLYETLWNETGDPFDGTGLLCCYRKIGLFDKALPLARKLFKDHIDIEWTAREVCWALIQGKMQAFDERTPLEDIIKIANIIIQHSPDSLAKKLAVFKVLKWAKKKDDWATIEKWVDLIDVDSLSAEPMSFVNGKKGWSDQCIWYNYKIHSLLRQSHFEKAKEQACIAENICPKQWLFFLRLQAHALKGLGDIKAAKGIYEKLCNKKSPEWWLLHEYGNLLNDEGEKDKALNILCKAALSNSKLEMMVKLFSDIAKIYTENGELKKARIHYYLEKFIREDNRWPLPHSLIELIDTLDRELLDEPAPISKQKTFKICKSFWKDICGSDTPEALTKKQGLVGKIVIPKDKPFSFVNTKDGLSAICFQKDIRGDVTNGDKVIFDVIPSYDKKKDRTSWKAIKIKKYTTKEN